MEASPLTGVEVLPLEVWDAVLSFAVGPLNQLSWTERVRLMRVCKTWRDLLWSRFTILDCNEHKMPPTFLEVVLQNHPERLKHVRMHVSISNEKLIHYSTPLRHCLKSIDLTKCSRLSGDIIPTLATLPNLVKLNLSECPLGHDSVVPQLSSLRDLQHLIIARCPEFTGRTLKALSSLEKLRFLNAYGSGVGDVGLSCVAQLPHLTYLDASLCLIGDTGVAHLSKLPHLSHLSLQSCHSLTKHSMQHIAKIKTLKILDASVFILFSDFISPVSIQSSLTLLPCLEELYLVDHSSLDDKHLAAISALSSLTRLVIAYCYRITNYGLHCLTARNNDNDNNTDNNGGYVLPRLTQLDISGCKIDGAGLAGLERGLPSLTTLKCAHCKQLPAAAILQLKRQRPTLAIIQ